MIVGLEEGLEIPPFFPPLRTLCISLGDFDLLVPGCGWFGVVGGVKKSPPPDEFGDGGGEWGGDWLGVAGNKCGRACAIAG